MQWTRKIKDQSFWGEGIEEIKRFLKSLPEMPWTKNSFMILLLEIEKKKN